MDTKEKIRTEAKELFNQLGYQDVKMRTISDALGISVGNLTYHYKKKIDLVVDIMNHLIIVVNEDMPITCLADGHQFMLRLIQSTIENRFYFKDLEFFQKQPEISNSILNISALQLHFKCVLKTLNELGYFDHLSADYIDSYVAMVMLSHLAWCQHSTVGEILNSQTLNTFLKQHWELLKPMLSEKGKAEFQTTIQPLLG